MIGSQLQEAIYSVLTGAGVTGGRVYDKPPSDAEHPYTTIGDEQVIDDGNSCADAWEAFTDIHVWSRPATGSKKEVKTIMAQIVPLLATTLTVADHHTVVGQLQSTRSFRDPDGITEHGVVTVRYLIETA